MVVLRDLTIESILQNDERNTLPVGKRLVYQQLVYDVPFGTTPICSGGTGVGVGWTERDEGPKVHRPHPTLLVCRRLFVDAMVVLNPITIHATSLLRTRQHYLHWMIPVYTMKTDPPSLSERPNRKPNSSSSSVGVLQTSVSSAPLRRLCL